ncbi:sulfurtransferase complex subunit TusD [Alteromonas sp. H39]|uniref:sulfurtransferase complex subunit TusD n=1 Tax=Alteromonas sp. H39 TaxID=3389876 RepID=UPI0039E1BF53
MASYSILVTSSPFSSDSASQAAAFCRTLVQAQHTVDQIFFYQDGVYHANSLMSPPSDETSPYQVWLRLYEELEIPLVVCITAATRRGILSAQEAESVGVEGNNLQAPFTDTGLGEFFSQLHKSRYLVQF